MSKTILHIVEAAGGVERYLVTLLTRLKQYSEFEHVLVCSESLDIKKFNHLTKKIIIVPSMHNAISFVKDTKSIFKIRKIINDNKPDIIYCHSSKAGAIGRMANFGLKKKLIYNPHGWSFNMKGAKRGKLAFYEFIEKLLAHTTDKIVCISEYEKESALEHRICRSDKLVVINNGIDFEEYESIHFKSRTELGIPESAFVVGTIGRLTMQKSSDTFVKMAKEIKEKIPEAFFVMVGDDIANGEFRKKTEELIDSFNLKESFVITGWVDDPLSYLDCFDVATLLSRWEGFGLVLLEYMLLGKPIVCSKADAIPYVVGDAALLVDIDDYKSAAESVVKLHDDKDLMIKNIEEGRKRVRMFDARKTAGESLALIKSVICDE